MSKRGWGGPSIRQGSHPPPYMDIAHDLKECQKILDEIAAMASSTAGFSWRMEMIRRALARRPRPHV